MLIKHIRDANNHPIGTVVALSRNEIGVSLCSKNDRFSKKIGTHLAAGRAVCGELPKVRSKIKQDLIYDSYYEMEDRAIRYFKTKKKGNKK